MKLTPISFRHSINPSISFGISPSNANVSETWFINEVSLRRKHKSPLECQGELIQEGDQSVLHLKILGNNLYIYMLLLFISSISFNYYVIIVLDKTKINNRMFVKNIIIESFPTITTCSSDLDNEQL